nr:MAG TPA: hypothetical protein [Caudoviricetes sp.]
MMQDSRGKNIHSGKYAKGGREAQQARHRPEHGKRHTSGREGVGVRARTSPGHFPQK